MKIAIMGFGTVGSGAYEEAKIAGGIEVVRILARHGREGYGHLNDIITADIEDIAGDPEIELVVESMGGIEPALEYVLKCLRAGKHVVTPNKNLISACYKELMDEASANGVKLRFTSAVGGGIPWLYNLLRTKRADEIQKVRGIVNGTCNYILDAMYEKGADFGEMLKTAQELGYAERDPSADIDGIDNGMIPIVAYNYGAHRPERIREAVRWALIYSFVFYAPFLFMLECFPGLVMQLFHASEHMMGIGLPAVRLLALSWLISIPSLVSASALQGLSRPGPSMVLTMARQAVLPVALAWVLKGSGQLNLIWLAFVMAEMICVPLALLFWKRGLKSVSM